MNKANVLDEWQALYLEKLPPMLGPDEKTIPMMSAEIPCDPKTTRSLIKKWVQDGSLIPVGLRRLANGKTVQAWKVNKDRKA